MSKNIVICLDGTGNEIEANISNVLKLYRFVRKSADQPVYYAQGVGTLVQVRRWGKLKQFFQDRLLGKVFGYGIDDRVVEAYAFIVDHYQPGDQLFIFGYSRGAYTARVLAGMIHAVGVLKPHQRNLIGAAYAAYLSEPRDVVFDSSEAVKESRFSLRVVKIGESKARNFRRIAQPWSVPIRFLGLFDTVGSVVVPNWRFKKRVNPHPHLYQNPSVEIVRHAVSIDEKRQMFPVSLWPEGQRYLSNPYAQDSFPQRLEEVWFSGRHGDVGGGNPRASSGLSQIPLIWMARGAEAAGLMVRNRMLEYVTGQRLWSSTTTYEYPFPDPAAKSHRSSVFWNVFEILPAFAPKVRSGRPYSSHLRLPFFRRRSIPEGAKIHDSVVERIRELGAYNPTNLPKNYTIVETPQAP